MTWHSDLPPPQARIAPATWPRVALRLGLMALAIFGGLALHMILRLIERPVFGLRRPLTAPLTQVVCRATLAILRLSLRIEGQPVTGHAALVANHSSWLDIFVLNSATQVYFVSKAEVADWPGIGWLARATGTVFIRRDRREAAQHTSMLETRLQAGHRLLVFPEGTSSDGLRVLSFKTTLFEAFLAPDLRDSLQVQPVSVTYSAPEGADPRALGWWGHMDFGSHLLQVLAMPRAGQVRLVFHPPIRVADLPDRKALALACEEAVRAGFG
jgi:1-acyl-sn-glycerol-3-phosphate acyltransferase